MLQFQYIGKLSKQQQIQIPVRAISSANPAYHAGDYSDANTDFLQITCYLLDPTSASESAKYSDAERLTVQKYELIMTLRYNNLGAFELGVQHQVHQRSNNIRS
ncbi:Hypothetical_protein [Hexamita inflata]|uniref:Hypothetical_protein n=1 Tax=Hexamita inflata TaxID=28002 RepID=A0ABP1I750_9EUKA